MRELGIDISNWTDVPTDEQVASIGALGFNFAYIGTSYWKQMPDGSYKYVGEEQCQAFERAGWSTVGEYQFPYRLHTTHREWFGDVEEPNVTLDAARNFMRQGAAGPYTRLSIAQGYDWDCVAEFPHAKLWDARYIYHRNGYCLIADAIATGGDVRAAIEQELARVPPFTSYWGFPEAAVTQWHDTIEIAGISMDLNFREEEGLASQEYTELYQRDEDIKTVVAKEATATDFLIEAVNAMAKQIYGDDDPRTLDIAQRVAALEKERVK